MGISATKKANDVKQKNLKLQKRNANQCISHHQKYLIKYKSISGIITNIDLLLRNKSSEQPQRDPTPQKKNYQSKTDSHKPSNPDKTVPFSIHYLP